MRNTVSMSAVPQAPGVAGVLRTRRALGAESLLQNTEHVMVQGVREQGRGAKGSPCVCICDALIYHLGWTQRLLELRGGVSAAEKGHRDLAASPPPSSQGLSSLVAHLDPGRSLQAAPCFCSPFPCSSPSDATKLA